jgi:hypothetical protein
VPSLYLSGNLLMPGGAERKIGAYIGLGAVIVIAIGGFRAKESDGGGDQQVDVEIGSGGYVRRPLVAAI